MICSNFENLEIKNSVSINGSGMHSDFVQTSLDSFSKNIRQEMLEANSFCKQKSYSNSKTKIDWRVFDLESTENIKCLPIMQAFSNDFNDENIFDADFKSKCFKDNVSITKLKREETFYENCQYCQKCGHNILRLT